MSKTVTGKIVYKNLGPGCWGIVENNGTEWRIVDMPEQLKYEGKTTTVTLEEVNEDFSVFMWGTPASVITFSTAMP